MGNVSQKLSLDISWLKSGTLAITVRNTWGVPNWITTKFRITICKPWWTERFLYNPTTVTYDWDHLPVKLRPSLVMVTSLCWKSYFKEMKNIVLSPSFSLLGLWYNRNTAWLRDTVRQTSRGKSAATGRNAGFPFIQYKYVDNTTIVKVWNYKSSDLLKNGLPTRAWRARQATNWIKCPRAGGPTIYWITLELY